MNFFSSVYMYMYVVISSFTSGLIIVMSEALSDDSLFSILMVFTVWEADQFYAIFCKQDISKQFFPWYVQYIRE